LISRPIRFYKTHCCQSAKQKEIDMSGFPKMPFNKRNDAPTTQQHAGTDFSGIRVNGALIGIDKINDVIPEPGNTGGKANIAGFSYMGDKPNHTIGFEGQVYGRQRLHHIPGSDAFYLVNPAHIANVSPASNGITLHFNDGHKHIIPVREDIRMTIETLKRLARTHALREPGL
jgi:hypothetical protein